MHRARGDRLLLMSASTDLYVPRIGRALGFDETICTRGALARGRPARRPPGERQLPRRGEAPLPGGADRARCARPCLRLRRQPRRSGPHAIGAGGVPGQCLAAPCRSGKLRCKRFTGISRAESDLPQVARMPVVSHRAASRYNHATMAPSISSTAPSQTICLMTTAPGIGCTTK